jgi:hypothetical protein
LATFQKFNQYVQDLANAVHNWGSHSFKVLLTNRQPLAADALRSTATELSTGNGYTQGAAGLALTIAVNQTNAAGTTRAVPSSDVTITSATGTLGPFQFVDLYNDTPTTPLDPLINWWDYGSAISLNGANAETFTVDFDNTNAGGLWALA